MCSGTVGRCFRFPLALKWTRDALALVEDLDAAGGQPRLDPRAGKAIGDRIIVGVDVDVIVDADPAHAPLAIFVRLIRQRLERRAIDLLEPIGGG